MRNANEVCSGISNGRVLTIEGFFCPCHTFFLNSFVLFYSVKSQTLTDNSSTSAFGPVAREMKIKNLKLYPYQSSWLYLFFYHIIVPFCILLNFSSTTVCPFSLLINMSSHHKPVSCFILQTPQDLRCI